MFKITAQNRVTPIQKKQILFRFILIAVWICLLAQVCFETSPPTSVVAQGSENLTMKARAGFDGKFKEGGSIPLYVTLENNGSDLRGMIRVEFLDGSGGLEIYEYPIELPSISRKEVVLYLFAEGYARTLQVSFVEGKRILEKVQLQLDRFAPTDLWYGILASNPTAFNILSQISLNSASARTIQLDLSNFPERATVLKSMDILIFSSIDTGKLTNPQKQALIEWTASGGRLILTGGIDWHKTATGFTETGLLPLLPSGSEVIRNLDPLISFSYTSEIFAEADQGMVAASGNLANGAQILAATESGLPLILRKPFGNGEVLYLTFDPSQPPFKNWNGREDFYLSLLSSPLDKPSWSPGIRNWIQAKEAALTLPNLSLPSPLLICGFLVIYILALGPLNYLLVRIMKRSEWGWVTIPGMVLCFSILIILIGTISRGSRVILNRLAMVQVWPEVPLGRIDGVMGIYSPTRSTYQAEADAPTLLHPLPADYGGSSKAYLIRETGQKTIISDMKLEVSGIEALAFEGITPAPDFKADLKIELAPTLARLRGSVTNSSQLTLLNAVLLYPGGAQQIGDFLPGQTLTVQQELLRAHLAGEPDLNPVFPYPTSFYSSYSFPYSSPSDTTITDILGTSNYYDDRKIYRKYTFLNAITNSNYGSGTSRGSGIYLAGWTTALPIDVKLSETAFKTQDNVLYLIAFRPTFVFETSAEPKEVLTLPPGAFKWSLFEGNDPGISPYNANIYPGTAFSFAFSPIHPIQFSKVKSLRLHIEAQNGGSKTNGIVVSVWDYSQNSWDELDDLQWGDNYLANPERFVGRDGSIRLNISSRIGSLYITRADFTLEVERSTMK